MVKNIVTAIVGTLLITSCAESEKEVSEYDDRTKTDNIILHDDGDGVTHLNISDYPADIDSTIQSRLNCSRLKTM